MAKTAMTGVNRAQTSSEFVKLVLDGREKLIYITGEEKQPGEKDSGFKNWRSENSLVTAWLLNSMEAAIVKPNMFLPTAKVVWDSVRQTYSDLENSSQIFELKSKLWQSKQGDHEIIVYYNEMVTHELELDQCYDDEWENPNDCARYMKREENDCVYMFLAGVNRSLDEVLEWKEAILEEMRALEKSKTWEMVDLPQDKKTVGCK
ncbi:uncharacterized protein LOC112091636 [Morus notabilis]|uniref:uncharacterized protein LOC112091636 n=1 Tax=Morus notabilis TaxID=981085 RepID=UPI000CED6AD3|nr:uncharacterized protein LOC112091636 [Morus notabilis]